MCLVEVIGVVCQLVFHRLLVNALWYACRNCLTSYIGPLAG